MLEQFLAALTAGSRRETFASGFGCVLFEVMCGCFRLFVLVLGFFCWFLFFSFLFVLGEFETVSFCLNYFLGVSTHLQ